MGRLVTLTKLFLKQMKRLPMNAVLRKLVSWDAESEYREGYSVVIACMLDLAPVAVANLKMCAKMASPRLQEMILVFDCPVEQIPETLSRVVHEALPSINVSILGYDKHQHQMVKYNGTLKGWRNHAACVSCAGSSGSTVSHLAMIFATDFVLPLNG
jgi:hypothetical protein